jgi:hypothetical protein
MPKKQGMPSEAKNCAVLGELGTVLCSYLSAIYVTKGAVGCLSVLAIIQVGNLILNCTQIIQIRFPIFFFTSQYRQPKLSRCSYHLCLGLLPSRRHCVVYSRICIMYGRTR